MGDELARPSAALPGAFIATKPLTDAIDPDRLTRLERAVFDALPNSKRKLEWWAGRMAARAALRAIGAGAASVVPDERGVPTLQGPNADRAFVSIAHGRRLAAAIAAPMHAALPRVGIDLVEAEDAPRIEKLTARVFTEHEQRLAQSDPLVLPLAWGAREAIAKATHTGMWAFAMSRVTVEAIDHRAHTIRSNQTEPTIAYEDLGEGTLLIVAGVTLAFYEHARTIAGL